MNTLLITGGAGFIGSHVVRAALSKGLRVINVDALTYSGSLSNLADIADHPNYHFVHQNICDRAAMDKVFEDHHPRAVMHLAAESHVDRSIDGPAEFVQTNIVGTSILLEAARQFWDRLDAPNRAAFRFHHISTDEVYGDLNPEDPAFTEATPYAPSSPYSASKAASDHLVRAWGRTYGLPMLISNCSNNYGPNQFPEKLIPVVILKALSGSPIPVYGNGENIRDWLYVEDHADALLTVLTRGTVGETYNIGGDNERTNIDIVRTLCAVMDDRLGGSPRADLIEFVTDRPGHDRRYAINADKIRRDLDWSPNVSADNGFAQTVDWYLNNRDWWAPLVKDAAVLSRLGLKARS